MNPATRVNVSLLSDDEIPACFEVLSKAFGHDAPLVDAYFPNHDTPSGAAQGSRRLTTWKQNAPNSTFLKAHTQTSEMGREVIIGLGIWTHMKEVPPAELEQAEQVTETWPEKEDREYITRLWRDYVKPRTQVIKEAGAKGVYVLEMLAVDPDYQRLSVGTALVKWGTKAADAKGVKAVVEGTPVARKLYEQCGMRAEIEEMRFDVGVEFVHRRKPILVFLTREPPA